MVSFQRRLISTSRRDRCTSRRRSAVATRRDPWRPWPFNPPLTTIRCCGPTGRCRRLPSAPPSGSMWSIWKSRNTAILQRTALGAFARRPVAPRGAATNRPSAGAHLANRERAARSAISPTSCPWPCGGARSVARAAPGTPRGAWRLGRDRPRSRDGRLDGALAWDGRRLDREAAVVAHRRDPREIKLSRSRGGCDVRHRDREVRPVPVAEAARTAAGPVGRVDGRGQALAVRRFDRVTNGGRVHAEDFAQVFASFPRPSTGAAATGTSPACSARSRTRSRWASSCDA